MNLKSLAWSLCLFFGLAVTPVLKSEAAEFCLTQSDEVRSEALSSINKLQALYQQAAWYYRLNQELVYGPLWMANNRRRDRFSEPRRIEGEVLFDRYQQEAKNQLDFARATAGQWAMEIDRIKTLLRSLSCGPESVRRPEEDRVPLNTSQSREITAFGNCFFEFDDQAAQRLSALKKLFSNAMKRQENFSHRVQDTLLENPSQHDPFENRFRDDLEFLYLQGTNQFIRYFRELREWFEWKWPGQECCAACAEDPKQDPVLEQVKADPQASGGVDGKVVNNTNLIKAFEVWEEEPINENRDKE